MLEGKQSERTRSGRSGGHYHVHPTVYTEGKSPKLTNVPNTGEVRRRQCSKQGSGEYE